MFNRTRERDVIPYMLYGMAEMGYNTTKQFQLWLPKIMPLYADDLEKSNSRPDSKFSEIVRNVKSHNTLQKKGLAIYTNGIWEITEKGKTFVEKYDFSNNIGYDIEDDFNGTISEGQKITKEINMIRRDNKLRTIMRKDPRYIRGLCECCGEDVIKKYHGINTLELHHIQELSTYNENDFEKTVTDAKKNIICLCPTCHRTTHRIGHIPYDFFNKNIVENCHINTLKERVVLPKQIKKRDNCIQLFLFE